MISKSEYELLKEIKQAGSPTPPDSAVLMSLYSAGMITNATVENGGITNRIYGRYVVTPAGNAAIEEYERMQEGIARENETLKASHRANIISIVSLCISSLFSIPALVVSIVSLLQ